MPVKKRASATSKKRASATTKKAKRPKRAKKSNVQKMIDDGSLSARHAAKLKPAVRRKIEKLTPSEVRAISKFHLEVCGQAQPNADGLIY